MYYKNTFIKRMPVLLSLLFLSMQCVLAQPTQAEIDKAMKQAQELMKKYGNDSNVNKAMKPVQARPQKTSDTKNNIISGGDTSFSLPSKNNKLLGSLPIRTFNRAELVSYLHNLNTKLTAYLRNIYGTNVGDIPVTAVKLSGTSIGFWLKGMVNESTLVALSGAESNPDKNVLLNNTGGILTSCGLGYYAIPVLQYALEKQPGNNVILNNLGQAYLDLGDDKSAEQYLLQCISSYKYYPDANLALAYIYYNRGNKNAAINYAENSLRGAWSSKADNLLSKLKPNANRLDYIKHRYIQPEFFDIRKFALLPQCRNVSQVAELEPQYEGYEQMIDQTAEKYTRLLAPAAIAMQSSVFNKLSGSKQNPLRPFGELGAHMLQSFREEYNEKLKHIDSVRKNYYRERDSLNARYEAAFQSINAKYDKMVYGDQDAQCKEITALNNSYLPLFADQTEYFQANMLSYYKDYFNDLSYWSYLGSVNEDDFHVKFYTLVLELLAHLKEINTTRFMESKYGNHRFYPCEYSETDAMKADTLAIETPDCYLTSKLQVKLGVFNLEISCEAYKLEAGEEIVGKIEYSRTSGDLTLALGFGASTPRALLHAPGIKGELEAEAKSQLYITFDKTGKPTDLGVLWEAELKGVIDIGEGAVKTSLGLEEGLTAGFGSGVQMKENSQLKQAIDKMYPVQPDDKQINKNVPLYKK